MKTTGRTFVAVAAASVLLLSGGAYFATADSDDSDGVRVSLKSINGSGISGSATYSDDSVIASATGMDPDKDYFSFVYGAGSDSEGNNPCILTGETLAGPGNTVGRWDVDEDGNGSLEADAPVSTQRAGTLSIREDVLNTNGIVGPTPIDSLVACGQVGPEQDTTLGRVQDVVPQLPSTKGVSSTLSGLTNAAGNGSSSDDDENTDSDDTRQSNANDSDNE